MQVFRFKLAAVALSVLFSAETFAQNSPFDSITAPSMPVISSPVVGSGFYSPGSIFSGEYKSSSDSSESEKNNAVSDESSGQTSETEKKTFSTVTADDLSSLSSMGLLDDFDSSLLSRLYPVKNTSDTKELLNKVLLEIEEIKDNAENSSSKTKTVARNTVKVSEKTETASASGKAVSRILRFSVNGYDILKTCRKIYISDVQQDGTFLVTGDRRYVSDGKDRTETFHLLFKMTPDNEQGYSSYSAAAAVTQDYLNENSFLYQLSQIQTLDAVRVGNFVTMRTEDPDWKMEFLIDLGDN